jgi:hypothetical protein
MAFPGRPGNSAGSGTGIGGGVYRITHGISAIANTNITGNNASTEDSDIAEIALSEL